MTIFCFLVTTLSHWCTEVSAFVIIIQTGFVENLDLSLANKLVFANGQAQKSNIIIIWTESLVRPSIVTIMSLAYISCSSRCQPVISDSIVIWHAWALLIGQRWIMIGPMLILLATICTLQNATLFIKYTNTFSLAMTFAYPGYTIQYSRSSNQHAANILINNIFTSKLSLWLTTNLVATLLIAYKL